MSPPRVLGIETSCDETAAAVVEESGRILSNLVASQVHLHAPFHGVVPEIACRAHEAAVVPLARRALDQAGCTLDDLGGIAVTSRPGLIGALLVGLASAKGLAFPSRLPLKGVNHLEAHVHAACMEDPAPPRPLVALVASGGHTLLYLSKKPLDFTILGTTLDDAAGEAFDKTAAMLGLPYPGGPSIEKAARGAPAYPLPVARLEGRPLHFSFSGLKTAVLYRLRDEGFGPLGGGPPPEDRVAAFATSFQEAAVEALVSTTRRAVEAHRPASVVLAGGVALNRRLQEAFDETFGPLGLPVFRPADRLCGDNAAMVAGLGALRLEAEGPDGMDLDAEARVVGKG